MSDDAADVEALLREIPDEELVRMTPTWMIVAELNRRGEPVPPGWERSKGPA
jgi:hypothetical protein